MKYTFLIIISIGTFAKATPIFAQKIESEYSIRASEAPTSARSFITQFKNLRRLTWIREESEKGNSVEAKFMYQNRRYSVEFSPEGVLEDLEIQIDRSDIDKNIGASIEGYLSSNFDYFKIQKIQEQYSYSKEVLSNWIATGLKTSTLKPKYELVVKIRDQGEKAQIFELLFDEDGLFLKRSKVVLRSDTILRF